MFAVIKTGGKQYCVEPGQKVKIEKTEAKDGAKVVLSDVLLFGDKDTVKIGTPLVNGAKVEGKVLKQGRNEKVIVFSYKSKTRRRKKRGHRQYFTEIEIQKIIF